MTIALLSLISRFKRELLALAGIVVALLMITAAFLAPAYAAELPSDDDQDVLIRSTLASFNDANVTGNYAVFMAKASKQFQEQVTPEKMAAGFEPFRRNKLFFESIVTDDYESYDKAVIDSEGALVLAGAFKGDGMEVAYKLRFVQNDSEWKLLGITVNAKKI